MISEKIIHIFSWIHLIGLSLLIISGATVHSTGSGLAVPDWPLSFGQFFPEMVGGVVFEHGHRLIAGMMILSTLLLMILLLRSTFSICVKSLGVLSMGLIIYQSILGGMTVLYGLSPLLSICHIVTANLFLLVTISITSMTSRAWIYVVGGSQDYTEKISKHRWIALFLYLFLFILIFIQTLLGTQLRHAGNLSILTLHIVNAIGILVLACISNLVSSILYKIPIIICMSILTTIIIIFQFSIGICLFLPNFRIAYHNEIFSTAHVFFGAFSLGITWLVVLWGFRFYGLLNNRTRGTNQVNTESGAI